MKLYLISQQENNEWDTYSAAVVCASSENEAQRIRPDGQEWSSLDPWHNSWATIPENVKVQLIGEAAPNIEPGVVLASFHAG